MLENKILRVGTITIGKKAASIFCKIKLEEDRLSISGVIGPKSNGDAEGGCGQIDMEFKHGDPADDDHRYTDNLIMPEQIEFARGWDRKTWYAFLKIWKQYHLNDMRAGCPHQEMMKWGKETVTMPDGSQKSTSFLYPSEHAAGVLTKACPECGYKYGTSWKFSAVPKEAIEFLEALPVADRQPAWV
jgi:hypothetical protein